MPYMLDFPLHALTRVPWMRMTSSLSGLGAVRQQPWLLSAQLKQRRPLGEPDSGKGEEAWDHDLRSAHRHATTINLRPAAPAGGAEAWAWAREEEGTGTT